VPPCIGEIPYRHLAATSILPCDEQTVRRRTGIGISGCGAQSCLIARSRDRRELGKFYRCFPWSVAANYLCKRRQIFRTYFLHRPVEGNASSRTKILSTQIDGVSKKEKARAWKSAPLTISGRLACHSPTPSHSPSLTFVLIGFHLQQ
jgi:hypothetical protein